MNMDLGQSNKDMDSNMQKYSFRLHWSEEDECHIATCPAFPGLSAWGESREEAIREAGIALELAIEQYIEDGWDLPAPRPLQEYSGQTRLRLPKSAHQRLAELAEEDGVSLNTLLVSIVSEYLGSDNIAKFVSQKHQLLQGPDNIHSFVLYKPHTSNTAWLNLSDTKPKTIFDGSSGDC